MHKLLSILLAILFVTDGQGTPCYNGNISSQLWSNSTYKKNGTDVQRGYRFTYDALDRMRDAIYGEGTTLTDKANRYNESILSYNANGAIKRLQRRGLKQDGEYGKIDNLNIQLNGSQIVKVTDDAAPITYSGAIDFVDGANLSVEYTYDGNGNLTSDANKGIAQIEYDDMNMPRRIQFANGDKIEYVYTIDGQKLRTIYYTASTQQRDSTEYFLGGMLTRKNGTLDKYLFDRGYYSFDNNTPTCHYYNRDHLGNIREVIAENGTVEQVTHYYPFGAPYSDSSVTNPALQPYKYNSKEFDAKHKLFTHDYGARQYDPLLIVWHGVDPLCEKDYATGAHVYCRNNPLRLKDPDGNFPIETLWDVTNVVLGVNSFVGNVRQGKWGSAVVDGIGIGIDVTAAVVPFVPGGVSTAIKTVRSVEKASRIETTLKATSNNANKITRRAAFRQAKRDAGIPYSQNFVTHKKVNAAKNGQSAQKGIEYEFHVEASYGIPEKRFIQDHYEGHVYIDGSIDKTPHFNIHQRQEYHKLKNEDKHYPYKD